jgi:hypothetical protein
MDLTKPLSLGGVVRERDEEADEEDEENDKMNNQP